MHDSSAPQPPGRMDDPVALAYVDAASVANDGTRDARPGSTETVWGEQPGPVTDEEFYARLAALVSLADAALVGVATLRDSDAAARLGIDLGDAGHHTRLAAREMDIILRERTDRASGDRA